MGIMTADVFGSIAANFPDLPDLRTIHFGGFGEPLSHPDIISMVARCKSGGVRSGGSRPSPLQAHRLGEDADPNRKRCASRAAIAAARRRAGCGGASAAARSNCSGSRGGRGPISLNASVPAPAAPSHFCTLARLNRKTDAACALRRGHPIAPAVQIKPQTKVVSGNYVAITRCSSGPRTVAPTSSSTERHEALFARCPASPRRQR